ncbi:CoA-binding protein [Tenacibaculum dicentrarchi]|uniref:CoA-binding protein n=1 Tax=Tenacibaculum dicentrarchi TaxID=669041 RepID=A0ABM9NYS1_9FLAO|nr:CoA-binding protein [Tenacibaculum dicentrarchi]SOS52885.1 CoA-binding protein [Tenacibaculum dicentrarchi]SOU87699.1 CoA-binding protein [Tenacibaculum dicentrarchi]
MKKTLVIGASLNPTRYSNIAIKRLVEKQVEVIAIGLRSGSILGVIITTKKTAFTAIDTVTLYLNPERQKAYYEYIISLKPRRIIFNPGTENKEFYALLLANKIEYEVACTLVLLSANQY